MKKLLNILLILAFAFVFAGCGDEEPIEPIDPNVEIIAFDIALVEYTPYEVDGETRYTIDVFVNMLEDHPLGSSKWILVSQNAEFDNTPGDYCAAFVLSHDKAAEDRGYDLHAKGYNHETAFDFSVTGGYYMRANANCYTQESVAYSIYSEIIEVINN